MSTLKVNKLRDTAGSADAITLDPNGGAVLAGVTTVTSVKVGAAVTISESGIEATGVGITCASINSGQIGGRRNIVNNGAMMVAQRGTSSTSSGYQTVDLQNAYSSGTDETPTQAQVDVSSGTGPYNEGFRKALKITNGNQTSGAQAGSRVLPQYKFEAQDLVNSGWNYTSSSSFITISFWVKSSVAQTYYGYFRTQDGTSRIYTYSVALSADTWTKVVKTIPGNSNIQLDNDTGEGIQWNIIIPFAGTSYTDSSVSLNTWNTYATGTRTPDYTTTWYTTNDATMEFTGLQAEVGAQATAFEHRSFGEEERFCLRYCYVISDGALGMGAQKASDEIIGSIRYPVPMRATPTATTDSLALRIDSGAHLVTSSSGTFSLSEAGPVSTGYKMSGYTSLSSGSAFFVKENAGSIILSAEL